MIIVSAGMEKSGSGWYYNMTNDLMVLSGHQDARYIRDKYRLKSVMRYNNCNIEYPILPVMIALLIPHMQGQSFVVKTHQAPTPTLTYMLKCKMVKATYIYRDPRDVVVSAYEHGKALRAGNIKHPFVKLNTIDKAVKACNKWIRVWEKWTHNMSPETVFVLRYEDLIEDTYKQMSHLVDFLDLNITAEMLKTVIQKYHPESMDKSTRESIIHFNKGRIGNYRDVLNENQLHMLEDHFRDILPKMGYEV